VVILQKKKRPTSCCWRAICYNKKIDAGGQIAKKSRGQFAKKKMTS
jgi:hypothetical protein